METDQKGDIVYIALTDINGNAILRDERNDSTLQNKLYTGHKYDNVTGLTYAHARYLDTRMHSFTTVDPMYYTMPSAYMYDPQQMNSYAYGRDNPIMYSDPTGKYNVKTGAVQKGDTVSGIVKTLNQTYGTSYTVAGFSNAFSIANPNKIYVGQNLQVQAPSFYQQYTNGLQNALFSPTTAYSNTSSGNTSIAQNIGTGIGAATTVLTIGYAFGKKALVKAGEEVLEEGPVLLSEGKSLLTLSKERLKHIVENHGYDVVKENKSLFNKNVDIADLVKAFGNNTPVRQVKGENYEIIVDVGRSIGTSRATGVQTSTLTIVVNKIKEVITAFPGTP